MGAEKPYIFRPYTADDISFIHSSWSRSYYNNTNGHAVIGTKAFDERHRPIRDKILSNPKTAIIVCVSKEAPDVIIGYSIVEKPKTPNCILLHYIYVKQTFKGQGIGKELFKISLLERPILFTHKTISAQKIIEEHKAKNRETFDRCIFTPHLI